MHKRSEEEQETYKVRPGTTNFGQEYEIVIIILMAIYLSFDPKIKDFKISTNNDSWSDFDDAVFEIFYGNGHKITVAVQLKHTATNITVENITKSKGDYSLDKHYESYKALRKNYSPDELKNIYLILCTTAGYSQNVKDFYWHKHHLKRKDGDEMKFWPASNQSFQFYCCDGCSKSKSEFLSQFFIYTKQMNCRKTQARIRNVIQEKFGNTADILDELVAFIERWRRGYLGKFYKLTRNEIVSEMCEMMLSTYVMPLTFGEKNLNHLEQWNNAIQSANVTFIQDFEKTTPKIWYTVFQKVPLLRQNLSHNWAIPSVDLQKIQINVAKHYLLNKAKDYKISLKNLYLIFWRIGVVPLILQADNVNCDSIAKIMSHVIKSTTVTKHFVIYTSDENVDKFFVNFTKFKNLTDLECINQITFQTLLNSSILIQNKFMITLKEMSELDEEFLQNITPDILLELMENPVVGKIETNVPKIYIERKISEFHVQLNALNYIREEIVFIICDLNNHYDYFFNNHQFSSRTVEFLGKEVVPVPGKNIFLAHYTCSIRQIRSFLTKLQTKYHLFLLNQKLSSFYTLKWIESTGSIDIIKNYGTEEGSNIKENNLLSFNLNNLVNVISADPGMGKSSLINQICKTYSSQNCWIMKFNLIEHLKYFGEENENCVEPLDYFYDYSQTANELTRICFESFVRMQKIVFLFDGFDEISPKFTNNVLNIIEYLKTKNIVQWITTRPSTASILEKKFNVLCYSICPFNKRDTDNFIKKYGNGLAEGHKKQFHNILDISLKTLDLHFLSTPLHLFMLCETVRSTFLKNSKFSVNNQSLDIVELYEKFIDMKFNFCEEKYLKHCVCACYDDIKELLREAHMTNHQICSLIALFGQQQTLNLVKKNNVKFLQRIRENKEKNGIISHVSCDNLPIFLHQTYAHYFAATWLAKKWKKDRARQFLIEIFSSKTYAMVRLFFDKILAKGVGILEAVLDQDFEKIQNCSLEDLKCKDRTERNALHLVCSWKPRSGVNYVEALLKKKIINPKKGRDKLLNLTPIDYADLTQNIVVIDKILQYYHLDLSKLRVCSDIKSLLYRCIKEKCGTFLIKLSEYLNSIESWTVTPDYDSLLFVMIESKSVEIVKLLLGIKKLKNHFNDIIHENSEKLTLFEITLKESDDDVGTILKESLSTQSLE